MKCVYLIAICLICVTCSEDVIFVEETNVIDPQFEEDAIESYKEAHAMIPTDNELFFQTLSELFSIKQNSTNGWKISENCGGFYNPNATDSYIILHVLDDAGDRRIRIFA
ncbi:uncharacterized protein LOC130444105 [Diorhabda sublineata]|uniref:uncharacterized protein LOC130444105 n=1 Tax=Diorhabda sublineata TaxID=1163346 RepID=UPI0024E065D3|nr:uncharacterized protein LOC130444105 [Diorhabda sublineata]